MSLVQRSFIFCCLLVNTMVYSPQLLDYFHHSRFISGSMILAFFLLLFGWKASKIKTITWSAGDLVLVGFVFWSFLSIFWAPEKSEALFYSAKWIILLGMVLTCRLLLRSKRAQVISWISKMSLLTSGLILVAVASKLIPLIVEDGFSNQSLYDLKILFGHKSLISAYMMLLLPLNLMAWPGFSRPYRWAAAIISGTAAITVLLLQSRAMYLGLMVLVMAVAWQFVRGLQAVHRQYRMRWLGLGISLIALFIIFLRQAPPELQERLDPSRYLQSQTASERRLIWYKTRGIIFEHPWLGVGSGNWKMQFQKMGVEGSYRLQDQNVIFTRVHNDFLEILAELGVVGCLLFIGIFLFAATSLLSGRWAKEHWQKTLLLTGLMVFCISALLDFPRERPEFILLLGLYLHLTHRYTKRKRPLPRGLSQFFAGVIILLLVFNVYLGVYRYQGETRIRKLLVARVQEDWAQVIRLAETANNRWHRFDPSAVPIAFYTGIAHYSLQQWDEAVQAFTEAQRLSPHNFHVLNNIATVYVSRERYAEALDYIYQALNINPRFEEALFNLAYCLNALGRHEEALQQVKLIPRESEKKEVFIREIAKNIP